MRDNSQFEKLAIRNLFDCYTYDRGPETERWGDIAGKFEKAIEKSDEGLKNFVELLLVENIVNYNYSNTLPLFEKFIEYCSENRKLYLLT